MRKRFTKMNGDIVGVLLVDVGILRYSVCLLEGGDPVAERSGFVSSWLTGETQHLSLEGDYFLAQLDLTADRVFVTWTTYQPEEDDEEDDEYADDEYADDEDDEDSTYFICSSCEERAENKCPVLRCRGAVFCDECWEEHNAREHNRRVIPLAVAVQCSCCGCLPEYECPVLRCHGAIFCEDCWEEHNASEHNGQVKPLSLD